MKMNRTDFVRAVVAKHKALDPDYVPEFKNEIANVTRYLLDEGQVTLKTYPGRAARLVDDFIGGPL